ncbi:MAG: preprotein translocase subunit SecE [Flavobacteriaceae bacterium]|jgi:preprotein translocase, secE subunit|nr:preprotein translocase subunit SecE [Flavobacteriaceae bacterium]MBB1561204.1 preprotein translocase subunit SecE [Flavobacteriaceae bacterium]
MSFISFVKDSFLEFREKVEWLKWKELQSSAIIVAVSTLVLALFTFGVDSLFSISIKNLYSLFIGFFN